VSEAVSAPAQACPKCGRKRRKIPDDESDSCPRCGLVFALWKEDSSLALSKLDSSGEEQWRRVQEDWDDSARHEEFLKHCLQTDALAAAGRLYRERLDDNPKDAVAAEMQSQILSKAALALSIHKTQPREAITRNRWFWVVILVAMALGIAGGLFWRKFR
jgi:ribosomal protein S27AE